MKAVALLELLSILRKGLKGLWFKDVRKVAVEGFLVQAFGLLKGFTGGLGVLPRSDLMG